MKFVSKFLIIAVIIAFVIPVSAQEADPKAEEPILLTSIGQCGGPLKFKVFLKRLKIQSETELHATEDNLIDKKNEGTPYKTVILVVGASGKGMGAAGVTIDDELKRAKNIIAEARKQGITIIGAHVTGENNRASGAEEGDNTDEMSIDAVCPFSDFMIVKKDGNTDNRFTLISTDKKIPLVEFEKNMDLSGVLKKVFNK